MRHVNLHLFGNLWQNLGDQQAGWGLIRCLRSSDARLRDAAQEYLVGAGSRSIKLLQAAVASGVLDKAVAAECIILLNYESLEERPDDPICANLRYDC